MSFARVVLIWRIVALALAAIYAIAGIAGMLADWDAGDTVIWVAFLLGGALLIVLGHRVLAASPTLAGILVAVGAAARASHATRVVARGGGRRRPDASARGRRLCGRRRRRRRLSRPLDGVAPAAAGAERGCARARGRGLRARAERTERRLLRDAQGRRAHAAEESRRRGSTRR